MTNQERALVIKYSGSNLGKLLKDLGITRTFLANALGVYPRSIRRWIAGTRTPSLDHARAIHEVVSLFRP